MDNKSLVRCNPSLIPCVSRDNKKNFIKNLNKKKFIFKKEIAKKLNLRFVPNLSFSFDNTFEYANKIEKILNEPKVLKDL